MPRRLTEMERHARDCIRLEQRERARRNEKIAGAVVSVAVVVLIYLYRLVSQ